MKMRFGLGVVAATLFIGCDDDATTKDAVDAVDASETTPDADVAPDVTEITPDVAEVEPDAIEEVEPDVSEEVAPDVSEVTPDVSEEVVEVDPIELVGTWKTEFGEETISETRWDGFCLQAIARVDNDENVAILETIGGEGCGGGFTRVIWNDIVDDAFDYCTTTYGATSAEEAATAETSNISDDLMTGCGGFPWSHLTRK